MLTPGMILKKERARKNYSLEEVSAATKIQVHYLNALENDEYNKFPSSVYSKGFLQNYAKFLGISSDRILALYRRQVGEAPRQVVKEAQKPVKDPKFVITPSVLIMTTVITLVIVTFGYLIYQFYNFQKAPYLDVTSPSGNITVYQSELNVEGKTDEGMLVTINDQAVKVITGGTFKISMTLVKGSNTIIVKAKHPDNVGNEAVVTRIVEYKDEDTLGESTSAPEVSVTQPAQEEQPVQEETPTGQGKLAIKIIDADAWTEVTADDQQQIAEVLAAGTTREVTFTRSLFIRSGRVSSTEITINGESQTLYVDETGVGTLACDIDNQGNVNCHKP